VAAAVRQTADTLSDAGHEVIEIASPFSSAVSQDFTLYWASGAAKAVADWEALAGRKASYHDFEAWTFGLIDYYHAYQDSLPDAVLRLKSFIEDWRASFNNYDVLLTPVLAKPSVKIGHLSPSAAFPVLLDRITEYAAFTLHANIAGAPAISLPLGMSGDQMPIGVMAAAVQGGDGTLIELAYELEGLKPWAARKPALVATS
jgi:amidase